MLEKCAKIAVLAVVAGSLNVTFAGPAHAGEPVGRPCGFTSVSEPLGEDDVQTGQINAGPVTSTNVPPVDITITCTLKVGGSGATHAGTGEVDNKTVTGPTTRGVAVAAGQVTYLSPEGQPVYLCTQVTLGKVPGVTRYWDAGDLPGEGSWSPEADSDCGEAIQQQLIPDPVIDLINMIIDIVNSVLVLVDPTICPIIGMLSPGIPDVVDIAPNGDISILGEPFYVCPPLPA